MGDVVSVAPLRTTLNPTAEASPFLPRDASAERGDATVSRPSVCPSVRLSVCNV